MKPFFVLSVLMFSYSPMLRAENYVMDPEHTLPVFEVNHLGFSTQRGRFDRTSGSMKVDAQKRTGSVELVIDAASINMGQKKWDDHMKSSDFFNTTEFPTIVYHAEQLEFEGGAPVAAIGTLTLLGVSRPLKVNIQHFTCGVNPIKQKSVCAADVTATLRRSDFGMTKYLPAVSDEVRALVPVEAFLE